MRPASSLRKRTGQRVEPGLAFSEDAPSAQALGTGQGGHAVRAAAPVWVDGDQKRRVTLNKLRDRVRRNKDPNALPGISRLFPCICHCPGTCWPPLHKKIRRGVALLVACRL